MTSWITSKAAPLPLGRRVGFVVVTLFAFALDALTVVPRSSERVDGRWTTWGSWETSLLEFLPVMAAVYAVLLLRRRWPLPALVAICAVSLAFAVSAEPTLPMAGVLMCLYTAAALAARRWQAWLALVLTVTTQGLGLLLLGDERRDERASWLSLLLLAGISFMLWVFGRREHHATLAAAGLPDQLAEHGAQAAAQERRRIARELHDIVAHSVSAMMMQAAGARTVTTALRQDMAPDPRLDTVERALATIENTGSQSMRELHRLLSVLRGDDADLESADTDSGSQPGMAQIAPLVELTRQSGLVVEVHVAGQTVRLDPSVGLAAYRVVQESLTNAMKHGGRGAIVDIFQNWQPDCLQLQVRSRSGHEGAPAGSVAGGNGLIGLRERVELVGGSFESGWVGDEFVATVVLPLTPTVRPAPGRGTGVDPTAPRTDRPPPAGPAAHGDLNGDVPGGAGVDSRLTT